MDAEVGRGLVYGFESIWFSHDILKVCPPTMLGLKVGSASFSNYKRSFCSFNMLMGD
jgi:hypothetical protein